MLSIIEKVIFLQEIDVFEHIPTEDLAHLALITQELRFEENHVIFREGDISDSLYMVIEGQVRLSRQDSEVMVAKYKDVFGTWALFDDEPRIVTAKTMQESHLLRIDREDFFDLLADHVLITQAILKSTATKLRSLMARVGR